MNKETFLQTWRGVRVENISMRWFMAASILVMLLQGIALLKKDTTVVMIPPQLETKGQLGSQAASSEVQVAWGMYIANMLGNVTPKSVGFLKEALANNLSSSMYRPVLASIEEQAETLKLEQISVSFRPNKASWDSNRRTVVVTGEHVSQGLRGAAEREERTYEMKFVVKNYRVLLDDIKVYRGDYRPNRKDNDVLAAN